MAPKILIVGAGQSGLQLALGLQQHGYDITVMSARTPEEIRPAGSCPPRPCSTRRCSMSATSA